MTDQYLLLDPTGVLKPGEIYFCSSRGMTDPETGATFHHVTGPVIVSHAFVPRSSLNSPRDELGWPKSNALAIRLAEGGRLRSVIGCDIQQSHRFLQSVTRNSTSGAT